MAPYPQIDLRKVSTTSIRARKSKVRFVDFASAFDPARGSFAAFVQSLPHVLVAQDVRRFVDDVVRSHRRGKPVLLMMGAHVVKVGLSPIIIDLVKRRIVTAVAMNSAAAIHDVEIAMWGTTSEDVEESIIDGRFGMARETGEYINSTLSQSYRTTRIGYGEAIGAALARAPNRRVSILATCVRLGVPVTVHAAIGTDITHQQPTMDGAATGELSFRDFKVLCNVVKDLRGAGVVMNVGSAVLLPEVFLKALTVARNLGYRVQGFSAANFDMIQHYRPRMNVVLRPTRHGGGRGYQVTGHHEIMIPLVAAMIKSRLRIR